MMKKYNIVMFNDSFRYDYNQEIMRGASNAVKECGHHLIHVPMMAPDAHPHIVNAYFRRMTDFLEEMGIDGYILPVGTLRSGHHQDDMAVRYMIEHIDRNKILCIEDEVEGITSIRKDNKTGMKELMRHLLDVHHYQKIGLIEGPENSVGSRERHEACVEELHKRHLSHVMTRGEFRGNSQDVIRTFLDTYPDLEALVCFSDQLAINAYTVIKERGLRIGKDIAVSGFDDIPSAVLMDPSLTTVNVEPYSLGYVAGKEMVRHLDGLPQQVKILPSQFIHRMSCGEKEMPESAAYRHLLREKVFPEKEIADMIYQHCVSGEHQAIYEEIRDLVKISGQIINRQPHHSGTDVLRRILNYVDRSYFNYSHFYESMTRYYQVVDRLDRCDSVSEEMNKYLTVLAKFFNQRLNEQKEKSVYKQSDIYEIILKASAYEKQPDEAYYEMMKCISQLGYKFAGIYVFEKGILLKGNGMDDLYFKAEMLEGKVQVHSQRLRDPSYILKEYGQNRPHTYTLSGLMANETLLGFLIVEAPINDMQNVFFTSLELGLAIKYLKMFKTQNAILETLSSNNLSLKFQAEYDELTGLLNRRGVSAKTTELFNIYEGMHVYIYYIDLDRLKYINDSFGHPEGDFAIQKVAEALRKSFRQTDLIGRIGGDEFFVVAIKPHVEIDVSTSRINQFLERFNASHLKPYLVQVSVGYSEFDIKKNVGLDLYLKEADSRLYTIKKRKKVLRQN